MRPTCTRSASRRSTGALVGAVLLAGAAVQAAPAASPAVAAPEQPARLELSLADLAVPDAELLAWELFVDGVRVAASPAQGVTRRWSGPLAAGGHLVGVRVLYRRELKMVVDHPEGKVLGFTFVTPGARWLEATKAVQAAPATLVHVATTVADEPTSVDDRVALSTATGALPTAVAGAPARRAGPARNVAALERVVQAKATWVAALVSPSLVAKAGTSGTVRARFGVDGAGYVTGVELERSSGAAALDASVAEVLRLAEPFPAFEGRLSVELPFAVRAELPPFPQWDAAATNPEAAVAPLATRDP